MKTKLYGAYTTLATVSVETDGNLADANKDDVLDTYDSIVLQRQFESEYGTIVTFRGFRLKTGDYGYRWFKSCESKEGIAEVIFSKRNDLIEYINNEANNLLTDGEFEWCEVISTEVLYNDTENDQLNQETEITKTNSKAYYVDIPEGARWINLDMCTNKLYHHLNISDFLFSTKLI